MQLTITFAADSPLVRLEVVRPDGLVDRSLTVTNIGPKEYQSSPLPADWPAGPYEAFWWQDGSGAPVCTRVRFTV
ncbi:MAG: hypothetical protein ACYDAY_11385 [Candidatus Dormibacteria bacterium]